MKEGEGNDITETEEIYGEVHQRGLPCLEVLCIRELHKAGCEFVEGESDGTVIQWMANYIQFTRSSLF